MDASLAALITQGLTLFTVIAGIGVTMLNRRWADKDRRALAASVELERIKHATDLADELARRAAEVRLAAELHAAQLKAQIETNTEISRAAFHEANTVNLKLEKLGLSQIETSEERAVRLRDLESVSRDTNRRLRVQDTVSWLEGGQQGGHRERLRVLIVEDDDTDVALLVHALRHDGFEPDWTCVDNPEDFVTRLDGTLDVIVADMRLPAFSGPEAVRLLHESGLRVPILLITGQSGVDLSTRDVNGPQANGYLYKGDLPALGSEVRRVIGRRPRP